MLKYLIRKLCMGVTVLLTVALCACGPATNPVVKEPEVVPTIPPSTSQSLPQTTPQPTTPVSAEGLLDLNSKGLTQEENAELSAQRTKYEAMSTEQQAIARESGTIDCLMFEHMWWEESISTELIKYAEQTSGKSFEDWTHQRSKNGQCSSIYDLARDFGITCDDMTSFVRTAKQEELYPTERLQARFAYCGAPITQEDLAYNKYMAAPFSAIITAYSWDNPMEIEPHYFNYYYQLTQQWPPETVAELPKELADGAYMVVDPSGMAIIYIGENTMHNAISEHFDVTNERLKTIAEYSPQLRAYVYDNWGIGGGATSKVVAMGESSGILELDYEYYSGADDSVIRQGTLRIQVDGEKYQYLSCKTQEIG